MLLLREFLNYTIEDVLEMTITEYTNALFYCWYAYNQRRVDLQNKEDKTRGKNKMFGDVDWSSINPVEQELRKEKRPPKRFLDSLRRK